MINTLLLLGWFVLCSLSSCKKQQDDDYVGLIAITKSYVYISIEDEKGK